MDSLRITIRRSPSNLFNEEEAGALAPALRSMGFQKTCHDVDVAGLWYFVGKMPEMNIHDQEMVMDKLLAIVKRTVGWDTCIQTESVKSRPLILLVSRTSDDVTGYTIPGRQIKYTEHAEEWKRSKGASFVLHRITGPASWAAADRRDINGFGGAAIWGKPVPNFYHILKAQNAEEIACQYLMQNGSKYAFVIEAIHESQAVQFSNEFMTNLLLT